MPYVSPFGKNVDEDEEELSGYGSSYGAELSDSGGYRSPFIKRDKKKEEEEEAKRLAEEEKKKLESVENNDNRGFLEKLKDQLDPLDNDRTWKQGEAQESDSLGKQTKDLGKTLFSGTEKVQDAVDALTGHTERESYEKLQDYNAGRITKEEYDDYLGEAKEDTSWAGSEDEGIGDRLKKSAGVAVESVSEFAPLPFGAAAKGATRGAKVARGAAGGAVIGGAGGLGGELASDDEFSAKNVALSAGLGSVMGGGAAGMSRIPKSADELNAEGRAAPSDVDVRPEALDDVTRSLEAQDRYRTDLDSAVARPTLLLPSGRDNYIKELDEIRDTLGRVRRGEVEATSFQDGLARNIDEAGSTRQFTPDAESQKALAEIRTREELEMGDFEKELAELEAQRASAVLDGPGASEAMKNAEINFRARMEEIQNIPPAELNPELQSVLISQAYKDYQVNVQEITNKFANRDPLNKSFDDARLEIEARRDETLSKFEDEYSAVEVRSAEIEGRRQEEVRNLDGETLRKMALREKELQTKVDEIDYAQSLDTPEVPIAEVARNNPSVARVLEDNLDQTTYSFDKVNPDKTVGIMQGNFGTQEKVMADAGLKPTWDKVVEGQHKKDYALHKDMEQMSELAKKIGGEPERATKIFNALDSGDVSKLDGPEKEAYDWFKENFKRLADEQGLPEEARISDYVTHLFKDKKSEKVLEAQRKLSEGNLKAWQERKYRRILFEADPELLRLTRKNATGKVKNQFTENKRTGAADYETDPFNAFRVYADKAYLKSYMEEPLTELAASKQVVSKSMADYINRTINDIKKVPSEQRRYQDMINNSLDSLSRVVEAATRGKVRADAAAFERGTKAATRQVYRGTLQYNPGTAITNFTQMANTYAEIGTRWTMVGFNEAMGAVKKGNLDELHEMGVLEGTFSDALINDNGLIKGVVGRAGAKSDKAGWFMFQKVEELNRATAYYGAKRQALADGLTDAEAKKFGAEIARKTQFKFSEMDTPHALQGPIAKNLTQLLTFSVKQAEYLKRSVWSKEGMVVPVEGGGYKLSKKGAARMARLMIAYTTAGATIGQLTGVGAMDLGEIASGDFSSFGNTVTDNIPFYQYFSEGDLPASPLVQFFAGSERGVGVWNIATGKTQHGNQESRLNIAGEVLTDRAPRLFIPGGSQLFKTGEGFDAASKGYSESDAGRVRFGIEGGFDQFRSSVFGQYNTEGGRDYVADEFPTFSETESNMFKTASPAKRAMYEDFFKANDQLPSQTEVSKEVTRIVKEEGNVNKAQRKAAEHNAQVEKLFEGLYEEYSGMVPQELIDYVESKKISPLKKDVEARVR